MKYFSQETFQVWNILSMKHTKYEIFQAWNTPSMKHFNHETYQAWNISSRKHFKHETFQVWNISSKNDFKIEEFSIIIFRQCDCWNFVKNRHVPGPFNSISTMIVASSICTKTCGRMWPGNHLQEGIRNLKEKDPHRADSRWILNRRLSYLRRSTNLDRC